MTNEKDDYSMSIVRTETSNTIKTHPASSINSFDNVNTLSTELTDKAIQVNLNLRLNLSVEHRMAVYGNFTQRNKKKENNVKIENVKIFRKPDNVNSDVENRNIVFRSLTQRTKKENNVIFSNIRSC